MITRSILVDAQSLPVKATVEAHSEAVFLLREKGLTFREIATFLSERGVKTDHTKVYRFVQKARPLAVPAAADYRIALEQIRISATQKAMLRAHFEAPNRSITYTQLAEAAGHKDHNFANRHYGQLGRDLGEELGFRFADAEERAGPFYSSALGMPNPYSAGHFQLVMHHELAKAIEALGWFTSSSPSITDVP